MLNSILNPNLPLGEAVYDPEEQVEEVVVEEDTKEILEAEKDAVQAAEKGDLRGALTLFDKVTPSTNRIQMICFHPAGGTQPEASIVPQQPSPGTPTGGSA